ncbi:lipopolysaccharide transport periplasmic protein LptA [Pseudotabrizicola alkalilacus]|uniref:Lipopolysaccharide transport periplasmic protein LptA n=1 Tax=Pseudotabrizicola alkalilacus TaxID=2305252 RepID=A0A411Z2T5_9RHOB|nr:lipopolysaccharide transport periplasmic protein LptA [Pseudotabrizicola alkalilacus]RGP37374.1 lipopolysaccharide transport periplasmic protein LptA [Pseudotabrizicola alkalilacus]
MYQFLRALCLAAVFALPAVAQQANIRFGGLQQDSSLPVEVTSDSLSVDQGSGAAVFTGNVMAKQGDMRLTAENIRVEYTSDGDGIDRLIATGNVTLVSPTDAAEASEAVYTIASGTVVMTGDVLLTQGRAAISGQELTVNLQDGTGTMTGGVKTVFQPGEAP